MGSRGGWAIAGMYEGATSIILRDLDPRVVETGLRAFLDGFVHDWSQEKHIRGAYSTPTVREHADARWREGFGTMMQQHLDGGGDNLVRCVLEADLQGGDVAGVS